MSVSALPVPSSRLLPTPLYLSSIGAATAVLVITPKSPMLVLGFAASAWIGITLGMRPGRRFASPALVVLVLAAVLRLNPADQPSVLLAAGLLATFAGTLPLLISPLRDTSFFPLPHLFGLISAVYVAIGSFLSGESNILAATVSDDGRVTGLLLTAVFLSTMAVLAWFVLRRTGPQASALEVPAQVQRSVLIACGCELGFFVLIWSPAAGSLGQIPSLLRAVAHVAVIVLFVAARRRTAPPRVLVVVVALVAVELLWGLGTSSLYNAVLLPIELLAAHVAMRRRVPWALIVVAASATVVGNAAKATLRDEGHSAGAFRVATARAYLGSYPTALTHLDRQDVSISAERFAYSQGNLLGYLSESIPSRFPRWDAQSYRLVPFGAVPRVLVPWKPRGTAANEFGRRYGLLGGNDYVTSANLPLAAEAYVNFGMPGLAVAGAALGSVLGLLARFLAGRGPHHIATAAVATAMLIRGVESDSSVVLGTVPWVLLVLFFTSRLLVIRQCKES